MQYMNIVRMRVKPEHIEDYIQALKTQPKWPGQLESRTIRFAENGFCGYGLWESQEAMMAQMDHLVSWLDTVRPMLEELSEELGVTDAISGPVVPQD